MFFKFYLFHFVAEVIGHYVIYFGGEATYQWENSFRNDIFVLNTGNISISLVQYIPCKKGDLSSFQTYSAFGRTLESVLIID